RILTRSTDDLTWWPSLSGSAAVGADIHNMRTFYLSASNTNSLKFVLAYQGNSGYQYEYRGGTGSMELKFKRDELLTASFDLKFASPSGPSALSYSVADAADVLDPPIAARSGVSFFQAIGTTARTGYDIEEVEVKINFGNSHLETPTGGTEGVRGVVRATDLDKPCATITLTCRADTNLQTLFTNSTYQGLMLWFPYVGSTTKGVCLYFAKTVVREEPEFMDKDGLLKCKVTLEAQLDDTVTGTTDLAYAGVRLGIG